MRLKRTIWPVARRTIWTVIFLLDAIVAWCGRRFARTEKTVVFVRTDNLGDFILWLPAARALREQWPWRERQFVLIGNPAWSDLAKTLGIFDQVIPISGENFSTNLGYRLRAIFALARLRVDLLVTAIHSREATVVDSIARAVTAREKVAAEGDTANITVIDQSVGDRWYDRLVPAPDRAMHEVASNNRFVERLFHIKVGSPWPMLNRNSVASLPSKVAFREYAVLAPGARASLRVWPAQHFAKLADGLAQKLSIKVAIVGTEAERDQAREILHAAASAPLDLTGQLCLQELIAVIQESRLLVTNETGCAHLGAALRVPTVCIVGGGHYGRFVPYPAEAREAGIRLLAVEHRMNCFGCNWRCIYPIGARDPAPCISSITIDKVWCAIDELLSESN